MKIAHIFFVVMLLAALASMLSCSEARPSDSQMEQTLNKHEAEFNRLVSMFKEDSALESVSPDKAYSSAQKKVEVELPKERMQEYRSLFKRLGLSYMSRGHDGSITMEAWTKSSFASSERKSYIYTESPPPSLDSSLDGLGKTWEGFAYKHVKGNWYLGFDRSF